MRGDDLKDSAQGEFDKLRKRLREVFPTLRQPELRRDLWPDMLRRLERPQDRVPWFDWALLAFTVAVVIFYPALIPALLYQL